MLSQPMAILFFGVCDADFLGNSHVYDVGSLFEWFSWNHPRRIRGEPGGDDSHDQLVR